MTPSRRPRRLDADGQSVWLTEPVGEPTGSVVIAHGIGENRTGNNYLLRALADACARTGLAAFRFDLPGHGESTLTGGHPDAYGLVRAVAETAGGLVPGRPVHWVARGLSAALLPAGDGGVETGAGLRVALSPPDPAALLSALDGAPALLTPTEPLGPAERQFWTAVGAEPNLVGGLSVPSELVGALVLGLRDRRWDVAVAPPGTPPAITGPSVLVCGPDPLLRSEFDRAALSVLIPRLLHEGARWLPAPS